MVEMIIGTAIGAVVSAVISWKIAEIYHKKAGAEFEELINQLTKNIDRLANNVNQIEN